MILRRMILAAVLVLWAAAWVAADEGMWTYNNFPKLEDEQHETSPKAR